MAYPEKPTKAGYQAPIQDYHRIRITLTSKDVKAVEKGTLLCLFFGLKGN